MHISNKSVVDLLVYRRSQVEPPDTRGYTNADITATDVTSTFCVRYVFTSGTVISYRYLLIILFLLKRPFKKLKAPLFQVP